MQLEKLKLRKFAVAFTILYSLMPFVGVAVSVYLTTYSYMIFCILFLILIILSKKTKSMNEYFTYALPFILYGILTLFVRTESVSMWGYRQLLFVMPIIVGVYIVNYCNEECTLYSKVIVLSIIITCITTARGIQVYPGAARWLATVADSKDSMSITLSWMNVGGYSFIYTIVLLYPLLVLAYKKHKINILTSLSVAILGFWCILSAEYTISLILFAATSVMFFVKRNLKGRDMLIFAAVTFLLMIIFSSVMSGILRILAENVGSNDISARLTDLAGGLSGLEKSDDNRLALYMRSFNTFITHPIGTFLSGGGGVGGHSFILDILAQYGIIGVFMLIFMYRKLYQIFYKKYQYEEDFGYIIWIFLQAMLLSTINTGMWIDILAFYVPVVLSFLYGGSDEKDSLDSKYVVKTN